MGYFEIFAAALAGFYALIPSYAVAIILLTLATRVLLLPLSIKQTRSMREMQRIQPELNKLRAKYKGNRQQLNEEQMKLFKEHGVNPLGGCGPLVLQLPVLIGLFYVIRDPLKYMGYIATSAANGAIQYEPSAVEGFMAAVKNSALANALFTHPLTVHQFLGLRLDCSSSLALRGAGTPVVAEVCGTGLLSALPYLILVVLMGITSYYQQKQMQAKQTAQIGDNPMAQQMQMFTKIMPLMLMVFSFSFPSGLVIYWLTTNIWTIIQQQIILRAVPIEAAATKATGGPPPKSAARPELSKPARKAGGGKSGSRAKPAAAGPAGASLPKNAKSNAGGKVTGSTPAARKKRRR